VDIRRRIWNLVEAAPGGDRWSRAVDIGILALILLNVVAVILDSVPSIKSRWGDAFDTFELISVIAFSIEYALRLWSCTTNPMFAHPITGRLRFAVRPMALIDLAAILPFYLTFVGFDLRSLRVVRLMRIVRIAKIGRYYSSLTLIRSVLRSKREELVLSTMLMVLLLIVSATLLYSCENEAQPDTFSSIPATMWWAVATLTTVGYGDVYPVTLLGKIFASVIAMLGIGMFALPTGILGAGFVEAIESHKHGDKCCPHCGEALQ